MGMSIQVAVDHYDFLKYETAERYASYWKQIHSVLCLHPEHVLEIGVGSGVTKHALTRAGISVVTADIDPNLGADCQADVRNLPFKDSEFDVVAAFQTLEHLPFLELGVALRELGRVSKRFVSISLPDAGRFFGFTFRLRRRQWDRIFDVARIFPRTHAFDGEHYWEINKKGFDVDAVRSAITGAQLTIKEETRLLENRYHRFFTLEKAA